jgi:hypothetical protein
MRNATIAEDGRYSIDVTNMVAPFLLRAEGTVGGNHYTIHSAATDADINGTTNITPLTDLIVANAVEQAATSYFDSTDFSLLTANNLAESESVLQQCLSEVLDEVGVSQNVDLLHTAFSTAEAGVDTVLDIIKVTVDEANNNATIKNIINEETVTDDLTQPSDIGMITASGTATTLSDWDAIKARFESLEALFASGLPTPDDPVLLAQFDQSSFLYDGNDLATFLSDLTADQEMVGYTFGPISLLSLTPADNTQDGVASVLVGDGDISNGYEYLPWTLSGIYNSNDGTTKWLIAGNNRLIEFKTRAQATRGYNQTGPAEIQSGISINMAMPTTSSVDYAVITGPGLPTSGAGSDGNTAGVLMAPNPDNDGLWLVPSPYTGPLSDDFDTLTDIHPRAQQSFNMYAMTSEEVAALASKNLRYTVLVYDNNDTPSDLTDDSLLGTYDDNVMVKPVAENKLNAESFPRVSVSNEVASQLWSLISTGGSVDVEWICPTDLSVDSVDGVLTYNDGATSTYDADPPQSSTELTIDIPPPPAGKTPVSVAVDINAHSFYFHLYNNRHTLP